MAVSDDGGKRPHEGTAAFVAIFALVLGFGVVMAVRVFLLERHSETELVRLTPRWLLPAVFGGYGLIAEWLYRVRWKIDWTMLAIATVVFLGVPLLVLPPFALLRLGSVAVALSGALLWWLALLPLFFEIVWPTL